MTAKVLQDPVVSAESQPFWDAAREGRFLVMSCESCGQNFWYPRSNCPFCWSERTRWQPIQGRGTVYSYSVIRRAKVPYVLAYVTLEEGPTVMTNLVDVDFDAIRVGMAVTLAFRPAAEGSAIPVFAPAAEQA